METRKTSRGNTVVGEKYAGFKNSRFTQSELVHYHQHP